MLALKVQLRVDSHCLAEVQLCVDSYCLAEVQLCVDKLSAVTAAIRGGVTCPICPELRRFSAR